MVEEGVGQWPLTLTSGGRMPGLLRHTQPPWSGFCLFCSLSPYHPLPSKCPSKINCLLAFPCCSTPVSFARLFLLPGCPSYTPHLVDSPCTSTLSSGDIFPGKPSPKPRDLLPCTEHTQHAVLNMSLLRLPIMLDWKLLENTDRDLLTLVLPAPGR